MSGYLKLTSRRNDPSPVTLSLPVAGPDNFLDSGANVAGGGDSRERSGDNGRASADRTSNLCGGVVITYQQPINGLTACFLPLSTAVVAATAAAAAASDSATALRMRAPSPATPQTSAEGLLVHVDRRFAAFPCCVLVDTTCVRKESVKSAM